jgi:hypothetical protein
LGISGSSGDVIREGSRKSAGTLLACMMIDADGFKVINDTRGHDAGDAMLRALSKQCQNWCRRPDQTPTRRPVSGPVAHGRWQLYFSISGFPRFPCLLHVCTMQTPGQPVRAGPHKTTTPMPVLTICSDANTA